MDADLLERSEEVAALREHVRVVASSGCGRLLLISGEAGIGKTTLVRRFCVESGARTRVLAGSCEPLFTPRPLGPLLDIADAIGGEMAALLGTGGRPHEVCRVLLDEARSRAPAIIIIEDVHWADEATLDVISLVASRIKAVPALMLVTFRDDGMARTHPLRVLLGELPKSHAVSRLHLKPLSRQAVSELALARSLDADELYAKTAGNPFFVTEVLAGEGATIPALVRDAVLARVARLRSRAQEILEAVSVVPPLAEPWLLEALGAGDPDALDECLASGMLSAGGDGVAFRHELARAAVAESLNPIRQRELHRRALAGLAAQPGGQADVTRLAHHAEAAGEGEATLAYAPAAGALAASRGAHREAVAQYSRALRCVGTGDPTVTGDLLERHAHEAYLTDQFAVAINSGKAAVESHHQSGDRVREGDMLRRLSQYLRCAGRPAEAAEAAAQSLRILEQLPPSPELAVAYAVQVFLCMNRGDREGTFAWGPRALQMAEETNTSLALLHTLNSVGTMEMMSGISGGAEKMARSLDRALELELEEEVGRAYINYGLAAVTTRAHEDLERWLVPGLKYCEEHGLDLWHRYLVTYQCRMAFDRGRWDDAVELAGQVLATAHTGLARIDPLLVIALIRARRGDPDWRALLANAQAIGAAAGELQTLAPIAVAAAELAWLEGRGDDVDDLTRGALDLSRRGRTLWWTGDLAVWRRRCGLADLVSPDEVGSPQALELASRPEAAAEAWKRLGCRYDAALALAQSEAEGALHEAHAELLALGARVPAATVARRLRGRGIAGIRRGPRRATLANAAGLTRREAEVLLMLQAGLSNAMIAARLHLSKRTVDHHVSALLAKLDAGTRHEAIVRASDLGLVPR